MDLVRELESLLAITKTWPDRHLKLSDDPDRTGIQARAERQQTMELRTELCQNDIVAPTGSG
jgi:hypothetical protein